MQKQSGPTLCHSSLADRSPHFVFPNECQSTIVSPSTSSLLDCKPAISCSYDELSPYTVVIGREKSCRNHTGNRRLRVLAMTYLSKYTQANTRAEKSKIVTSLIKMVQDAGGSFVRFVDGRWMDADRAACREKVGVVIRDLLHDKYRSSTKSKVIARRHRRNTPTLDDESAQPLTSTTSMVSMPVMPFHFQDGSHDLNDLFHYQPLCRLD